ncbi:hypothetical protein [Streptomyces marianii]|uniref:Uncharacterized protein n=1 Tax=Streptomyces marianii TaxID=1817406 RepID=A0A5R9DU83_9ACTN|nr:hypothetical protein [Streptomyces marianii]TLQ39298.1 hypothetical protein FEF34_38550 [Streptomyces marianii]
MAFTYQCPRCGTASRPYFSRAGAEGHGVRHRLRRHDGDYPVGERIQRIAWVSPVSRAAGWRPSGGDAVAAAVAGLLVVWSIWHAFTN